MGEDVVNAHEGLVDGPGHALREAEAHEKGTYEPGHGRRRHSVQILRSHSRLGQGARYDPIYPFAVLAARDLGNDALIFRVEGNLSGDYVGQDARAVLDDGRGAFVAGSLNSQDSHRPPPPPGP